MTYQKPYNIDTTRYQHSEDILRALSVVDEYFKSEKPEDPLVLIVDTLLALLEEDERAVVEMCIMKNISMHEAARTLGFINSSGKEDHKMVSRRLGWAINKMKVILESPSFATAIAGHKMPIDNYEVIVTDSISNIIKKLDIKTQELNDEE
jgi:hypothetical protein